MVGERLHGLMKFSSFKIAAASGKLRPRCAIQRAVALSVVIFLPLMLRGQVVAPAPAPNAAARVIRGTVKLGNMPIPGAAVLATNADTKGQVSTSTDVDGTYSLRIPENGHYTVRVQMTAFAVGVQQVVVDAAHQQVQANFELMLQSRARVLRSEQSQATSAGRGFQSLSVFQSAGQDAAGGSMSDVAPSGMPVPGISPDSATESVAISGNTTSSFNTLSADEMQQRFNDARQQGGGFGGGGFGGGGFGGGGFGGGGFGRRGFDSNQPHGSVYYGIGDSALNASPYSLTGAPKENPSYVQNSFGGSVGGPLNIPHLPAVKVDYRRGYYAPADYQYSTKDDKERQLEEELASELPTTDLPLYLGVAYFRLDGNKFFVPISLVVPGSQIPFVRSSDRDKATLDVIGMVRDNQHHPLNRIRDTVKLAVSTSTEVQKKNVQYDTGMSLLSGKYHLKFVVRENQTGRMGSFETDIDVPDLKSQPLKMSSIVLASQIQPSKKSSNLNPLIHDGNEIIPNITHVFSATQHLLLYYEVYDPARPDGSQPAAGVAANKPGIRLLSNVAFFQGKVKSYESSLVQLTDFNARSRKAAVFQLDVPLTSLNPGFYTCQVNVIDDAGGHFLFPRLALLIRNENTKAPR